ncbi:MAG: acyl-CoA carboxylase subunit beta [Myxococcales bacterium]|nr:acyl-CoA carboxylase subunit beta [Myxococcales bacterium]
MSVLASRVVAGGPEFEKNRAFMEGYVAKVRAVEAAIEAREQAFEGRARKRGKLLPRERLGRLLDRGAPFLELSSIAGYRMFGDSDGSSAGGTLIAGIGFISGRRCLITVWNYAINGGTISAVTVKKMLRLQEIALQNRLPIVSLSESGGANLGGGGSQRSEAEGPRRGGDPFGANNFLDGGMCYANQARLSAAGIPQIVVSHGNATAGGAYHVALSDYIVLVRGQSQIFLAGPPLLKAATGADADAQELGGAEMHATISGTGEYLAEDDADGVRIAREIVAQLPGVGPAVNASGIEAPLYDPAELIGIVPEDPKRAYDVRELIARLVDGSRFLEFSAAIDQGTICGHATLAGHRVGLIGNNAPITPSGAKKAAQFLQLCDQSLTPVIFIQNTTGFLVGVQAEQDGQVKHGSKMIQAVANLRTTKIALVVGNSYGAGNYAMASRALSPHFIFAWPTARNAVMGGAQAAKVMEIVALGKLARSGIEVSDDIRAELDRQSAGIEASLDASAESMYCSARLFDDGLIDPRDSRKVLAFVLDTRREAEATPIAPNTFGVQRL